MTSGGTDSITMAMKTARDYARASSQDAKRERANIVSAIILRIWRSTKPRHLDGCRSPADPACEVDGSVSRRMSKAMIAAVDDDETIMMVGSAPNFPHGIIDPIEELSAAAIDERYLVARGCMCRRLFCTLRADEWRSRSSV